MHLGHTTPWPQVSIVINANGSVHTAQQRVGSLAPPPVHPSSMSTAWPPSC
jgi:hypothetical protein